MPLSDVSPPANPTPHVGGRAIVSGAGGATWNDLRKKSHVRLAERVDPVRNKHKPISILRQESRRTLELFLDAEYPYVSKADRQKLIDDVLGEAVGLGPLEELFRDDSVIEILVLAPNQVIARRGETWLPASVTFRDADQLRVVLARMIEQGEPVMAGADAKAAVDVRLTNGFRAVAVVPPAVMDVLPVVAFARIALTPTSNVMMTPGPRNVAAGNPHQSPAAGSSVFAVPAPRGGSGVISTPGPRSGVGLNVSARSGAGLLGGSAAAADLVPSSSIIGNGATIRKVADAGPNSGVFGNDPYSKIRGKITQRLITKIASAGIYDIHQIPKVEMQRIVTTMVEEANGTDKLGLDPAEASRMTLEILTAMQV